MRLARFFPRIVLSALLIAMVVGIAWAQFGAGIEGTVSDASGALIPKASVELVNNETKQTRTTTTSAEGFYRFSGLAPGRYTVTATAPGFKKQQMDNVSIRAEQTEGLNLQLATGDVTDTVTVTDTAGPDIKTENAEGGRVFSTRELQSLPQIGRDPYELVRLTPGIFGDGARNGAGNSVGLPNTTGPGGSNSSIYQTENQVPISSSGQRLSDNNFMIDGVSVNSLTWGGAAVITPNQDSVKELTVLSSPFSAEYGRNSGAQILVVSKNGTNSLHGGGFFKYNSPSLNAFNKYGGVSAPPTRVEQLYRQFGGNLGGPLIKNKLFWFFSYEGLRNNSTDFTTAFVETPQYRQAVIAARPDGVTAKIFQAAGIQPRIVNVLSVPCPSGFGANCQVVNGGLDIGSITGARRAYTGSTGGGLDGIPDIQFVKLALPGQTHGNQYNGRVDFNLTSKDMLAFSTYFTLLDTLGADSGGRSRPMGDLRKSPINSLGTLTYNRIISPTLLNEARFNATRFYFNQVTASSNVNFGIPRVEVEGLPFDRIRFGAPRDEATPGVFAQNTFEFRDTLSKVLGNHAFKFGGEVRKEQDNDNLVGGARPLYSFVGLFNLANDTPVFESINANPVTGQPADAQRYFRSSIYGLFAQDDWKVAPNLTLNFGLRWEYFTPLRETRGRISNIAFGSNGLQNSRIVVGDELYKPDRKNFAPRFGFAYNPDLFSKKLVIRGGFGIFYNRIPNVLFANTRGNPPFFARYGICCGFPDSPFANGQILYALGGSTAPNSYPVNPALAVGIDPTTNSPKGVGVEIYGAQNNTPNPVSYLYSFDFQYQLPGHMTALAAYNGSAGHHDIRLVNQNFLYPNNPAFFAVYIPQPDVNSEYNAMLLSLNRTFTQGFAFGLNYRWSRSIDTLSYGGPGGETNQTYPQNLKTERGPSDYDATHLVNLTSIYAFPWLKTQKGFWGMLLGGYEISSIYTFHTGFPWTPKIGQSVSTPGGPSLSPSRPTVYFGGVNYDFSNDAFIRPGGNFPGGGAKYFNITSSGPPGIGRNVFRGPRFTDVDFSFSKRTALPWLHLGETTGLELRANFYNAFNKLNLAPFRFFDQSTKADDSFNFGRAQSALAGRVVELQAKFTF
jgi:hypothetical protein